MKKFLLILTFLLVLCTSATLWLTQEATQTSPHTDASQGKAAIGGAFTLTNQEGVVVQDGEFRGKLMLVFFGFTSCPDICPVGAATISKAMELLGEKAAEVAPVFITVDPTTDTPAVLKSFLANFDPRFVGLTGTDEQIRAVANAYKAYYAKAASVDGNAPLVDHSGYIYLMGKDGSYIHHFTYDGSSAEIADAVRSVL